MNLGEYSSPNLIIWGYGKHGYKTNLSVHPLITAKFLPLFHNPLVVAGSKQRFTGGIKEASFLPPSTAVWPCSLPG